MARWLASFGRRGNSPPLIRLEQLWNKLLEQSSFSLYCAYAVDIFGKDFDI